MYKSSRYAQSLCSAVERELGFGRCTPTWGRPLPPKRRVHGVSLVHSLRGLVHMHRVRASAIVNLRTLDQSMVYPLG